MITVTPPIEQVFKKWKESVSKVVGKNLSMDMSQLPSSFPYMRMSYMGGQFAAGDLEGNESAITLAFQIESFATGQKKLTKVYELDAVSHQVMVDMGFRRTYNGQVENIDPSIVRVISRYSRIYTGQLLGE